ncbi:MAG TPA: hypothetical protein VHB46_15990 [Burkholderiales bacterium]|nr:hypothetical protein [Burkholderiales bacterium]
MKTLLSTLFLLITLASTAFAGEPEFDGQCVMGLTHGYANKTDCSVFWLGPNDKVYCFSDDAAKASFLKAPAENIARAQAVWDDPANLKRLIKRE